jgi:hypothetical protein
VIETPEHVLRFVAADADVHGFEFGKVLLPRLAPLNRDAVADEQHVERPLVFLHRLHMRLVQLQPRITAEMTCAGNDRPKLRQMLVRLATWTAIMLGLVHNIGTFFCREWPAGLLRFRCDVRVVEGVKRG